MIEIIHFLTDAKADKDSLFRTETLVNKSFGMTFDVSGETVTVERSGQKPSKTHVFDGSSIEEKKYSHSKWLEILGDHTFKLNVVQDHDGCKPTFRSLFAYFVRREFSNAFVTPEKQAGEQQIGDCQIAFMFFLGLDWKITSDWQQIRDREKTVKEMKKAVGVGAFSHFIGKAADLRTKLTIAEAGLDDLKAQVDSFRVLPKYRELEAEADKITKDLAALSNGNTIDTATIRDLQIALEAEAPPLLTNLERMYAQAGVVLPTVALKRYDEVRSFHESVIRNRRDYLAGELWSARRRLESRNQQKEQLDRRRAEVMGILKSHGALDQVLQATRRIGKAGGRGAFSSSTI